MGAKSSKVIVLNGKTYHSIEEMPPDVRETYELAMCLLGDESDAPLPGTFAAGDILADRNKNGKPDILENITADNIVVSSTKVIVDGKEFDHIGDLPLEARARYDEAMSKLDANRNGVPDFIEGMTNPMNQTVNISTSFQERTLPDSMSLPVTSVIEPDTASRWVVVLGGLLVILFCAAGAAGVWYFFLR